MKIALWLLLVYLPIAMIVLYTSIMHFDRVEAELTKDMVFFGRKILLPFGLLHNLVFTVTWGTLIFLDLPRELAFTKRLDRYWQASGDSWRKPLALFIRVRLDPFDKRGIHS